ncbi:SIMPL domain-containing protein [Halobacillus litoralis]|uniref:SIMPL domain-containing protein n=1 Tax=Halobacillus litoralis TaxID=45668 RepID=UPI001CD54D3B|nr:SIMPL domain-containing protein [Halobacillus litoralis]MCA1023749.1 SIMPL domain-containing protein [Halobacillus litoralis]
MYQAYRQDGSDRQIRVQGSGSVKVKPDTAVIQLGVVTEGTNLTSVQNENASTISRVKSRLMAAGVEEENIQTSDYSVYPQYDYVDGKQEFRGYQVSHMLTVTVEDIEQTGAVIDAAVQSGANRVTNIEFTVSQSYYYYQKALQIALGQALATAQTIANTMNVKLDRKPFRIVEEKGPDVPPVQPYAKTQAFSESAVPIEPGLMEIEARVDVWFPFYP